MIPFADLVMRHRARPIVVMGGGVSLPQHVEAVRHSPAAWISANEHGARLRPVDYIVAVDDLHQVTGEPMAERLAPFGAPIITPRFYGSYRMPAIRFRSAVGLRDYRGNSGMQAIWVAWALGAFPVIACGFDCYQGGTYWHDHAADSSGVLKQQTEFDERCAELLSVIGRDAVRVVGGPLSRYWPSYDPEEVFDPYRYDCPAELRNMPRESYAFYRVLRNLRINRGTVLAGAEIWISDSEAEIFIRRGHVRRLSKQLDGVAA